jgi:heme-degrading monooxygenase HmoA
MLGAIFAARLSVPKSERYPFWNAALEVERQFERESGNLGLTLWVDTEDPESYLLVWEATSMDSLQLGIRHLIESPAFFELRDHADGVASNRWISVVGHAGELISKQSEGAILSASVRSSDPGMGATLASDYEFLFQSLSAIQGFKGYAYGYVNQLSDQYIGFAIWESLSALHASMPNTKNTDLRIFIKATE